MDGVHTKRFLHNDLFGTLAASAPSLSPFSPIIIPAFMFSVYLVLAVELMPN